MYAYGSALVMVRDPGKSVTVMLFGVGNYHLAINYYSQTQWLGWKTYITNTDLIQKFNTSNFCILNSNLKSGGYGRTICFDGNNAGVAMQDSDSYYIAVDYNGNISIGTQSGSSTTITWTDK